MGYGVCVYNSYGHRTISCFGFHRNYAETAKKWYGNHRVSAHFKLKLYGACAMSVRSPYAFSLSPCSLPMIAVQIVCPQIIIKNHTMSAKSSQRLRTAPARPVYGLRS